MGAAQDRGNTLFLVSATSPLGVVHIQVHLNRFCFLLLIYISLLPARLVANSEKHICASGWFVGMENSSCEPNTVKMIYI